MEYIWYDKKDYTNIGDVFFNVFCCMGLTA